MSKPKTEIVDILAVDRLSWLFITNRVHEWNRTAVEHVIQLYKAASTSQRRAEIIALSAELREPCFYEMYWGALNDTDETLQLTAVEALAMLGDKRASAALLLVLKVAKPALQIAVAKALGQFNDPESLAGLLEALSHNHSELRCAIIEALDRRRDEGAIESLKWLAFDEDMAVRKAAFDCLVNFGTKILDFLLAMVSVEHDFAEEYQRAFAALRSIKASASLEPLLKLLASDKGKRTAFILETLSDLEDRRAASVFAKYLNTQYKRIAITGLLKMGPVAMDVLLTRGWIELSAVKLELAHIFAAYEDKRAFPLLIHWLTHDSSYMLRLETIYALGKIADKRATRVLCLILLNDKSVMARYYAAISLRYLNDTSSVESLLLALMDSDYHVRMHSALALGELQDKKAVPLLVVALADKNLCVTAMAIHALGRIGDDWAVPALKLLLQNRKDPFNNKKRICDYATEALKRIGSPAALTAIKGLRRYW